MIRVVADTNIVLSAYFWDGLPEKLLLLARTGDCELLVTDQLITELRTVLSRDKFTRNFAAIGLNVDTLIGDYSALVKFVEPAKIPPTILDDPPDDNVLACAVGGEAQFIVSGNRHLLRFKQFQGIEIKTVADFLKEQFPTDMESP